MIPKHCTALAVCVLHGLLWLQGLSLEELLPKPKLNITEDQIVIHAGDFFAITCRGAAPMTWLWGNESHKDSDRWTVSEQTCSDNEQQICSRLTITNTIAQDTSYFTCGYNHLLSNKDLVATTYVFVKGKSFILLDLLSTEANWWYQLVFSCWPHLCSLQAEKPMRTHSQLS
nr:vascular endothelial growth factor receptor 3-like [Pelodiscus sinensis]|eukprot:XP_014435630.1 vascular endothelial growth factor receptor 3-like [Pelodiscus sinensis]